MTIPPGDGIATGKAGRGEPRASHADREQVIGTIKTAFVQGMLGKDELDARIGRAFASKTYAELTALTADLPAGLAAAQPPKPARTQGRQPVLRPGLVAAAATEVYAAAWLVAFLLPRDSEGESMAGLNLVVMTTFVYVTVLVGAWMQMLDSRREKRSARQLPRGPAPGAGGQASRHLPSVDPGRLPPTDPGPRHTAEAAPGRRPKTALA